MKTDTPIDFWKAVSRGLRYFGADTAQSEITELKSQNDFKVTITIFFICHFCNPDTIERSYGTTRSFPPSTRLYSVSSADLPSLNDRVIHFPNKFNKKPQLSHPTHEFRKFNPRYRKLSSANNKNCGVLLSAKASQAVPFSQSHCLETSLVLEDKQGITRKIPPFLTRA